MNWLSAHDLSPAAVLDDAEQDLGQTVATVKSYALMSLHFLDAPTICSELFGLMRLMLSLLASFRLAPWVAWMLDMAVSSYLSCQPDCTYGSS